MPVVLRLPLWLGMKQMDVLCVAPWRAGSPRHVGLRGTFSLLSLHKAACLLGELRSSAAVVEGRAEQVPGSSRQQGPLSLWSLLQFWGLVNLVT